jgi:hypothetical protein
VAGFGTVGKNGRFNGNHFELSLFEKNEKSLYSRHAQNTARGLARKAKKFVYLTCFFCNKHHLCVYKLYVLALEHVARCLIPHIVIKL